MKDGPLLGFLVGLELGTCVVLACWYAYLTA